MKQLSVPTFQKIYFALPSKLNYIMKVSKYFSCGKILIQIENHTSVGKTIIMSTLLVNMY